MNFAKRLSLHEINIQLFNFKDTLPLIDCKGNRKAMNGIKP